MVVAPRFNRVKDPVISHLCRDYCETDEITTKSVRDSLRYAPYKSVAPDLYTSKKETDEFVMRDPDALRSQRANLQNRLHGLELQRMELERQMDEEKLGHQEGNVALREIGSLVAELTAKLNTIEREQANFNKHLHDLKAKNEDLADQLRRLKGEEATCEKKVNKLGEEKVELAQRLAKVTQEHNNQQKLLAEFAARRMSVEEALEHVSFDSNKYADLLRDLADNRRALERELKRLKFDERETEKRIEKHNGGRSTKHSELASLLKNIEKLQREISEQMPVPSRELDKPPVEPLPLAQIPPPREPSSAIRRLTIPRHTTLPTDYEPSNKGPTADVVIPQVPRGNYEESAACCVPVPRTPPQNKDESYYSCETTKELMNSRRDMSRPQTAGERTRYVGLNTYNAGGSLNMGTGLMTHGTGQKPFPTTEVPQQMDTTYGHYFGKEGTGLSGRRLRSSAWGNSQRM